MLIAAFILIGLGLCGVSYPLVVYPMLLKLLTLRRSTKPVSELEEWPKVSITIPAYNEEAGLRDTLNNILELDYPKNCLQVLVVSDASTDRTDEIAREFADRGVELLRLNKRSGKTAAENAARSVLTGEIIVNTDASIRMKPNAIRLLIKQFKDPTVGIASGTDVSLPPVGLEGSGTEASYVDGEMRLREMETSLYGIVGASGCLYAARSELHDSIVPEALSRDFAAPLIAKEQGFRSVSVPDAICFVRRSKSLRQEYRRKVRTMTRGLETLYFKRHLLNPFKYGVFAWMLCSHKLLRWLVPFAILMIAVGTALIAVSNTTLLWTYLLLVTAIAVVSILGWLWPADRDMPRAIERTSYVFWGIVAALHAWTNAVRRDLNPVWEPTKRT